MYTKDQLEAQLKNHAKSAIFERDFMLAFNKYMNEKKESALKTSAEQKDWKEYRLKPSYVKVEPFTVAGDDNKFHKAKWEQFMKDSCFYFDAPTLDEEREMRQKLQFRYDDLFADSWRPPLQSRRDLVQWTCEKRNEYMSEKQAPETLLEDCANYNQLLKKYGPNYDSLKAKLGFVRGLWEAEE